MIQATSTELQASETFKLNKSWEEKAVLKDKKNTQQAILKILLDGKGSTREYGTIVDKINSQALDY